MSLWTSLLMRRCIARCFLELIVCVRFAEALALRFEVHLRTSVPAEPGPAPGRIPTSPQLRPFRYIGFLRIVEMHCRGNAPPADPLGHMRAIAPFSTCPSRGGPRHWRSSHPGPTPVPVSPTLAVLHSAQLLSIQPSRSKVQRRSREVKACHSVVCRTRLRAGRGNGETSVRTSIEQRVSCG